MFFAGGLRGLLPRGEQHILTENATVPVFQAPRQIIALFYSSRVHGSDDSN